MSFTKKHKRINYVKALSVSYRKPKINRAVLGVVFSLLFFVASILSVYMAVFLNINKLENELSEINYYLNNEENQALYNKTEYNYNIILTDLTERKETLESKLDSWVKNPGLTSVYFEKILDCSGDKIVAVSSGYDDSTAVLTMEMTAKDAFDIYDYINRLKGTGIIDNIDYNGYIVNDEGYNFTVFCHVSAGGGEQ